jgi:PAS domain S-box-containing protein
MFVSVNASSGKIIECNQAVIDALGYTKEELFALDSIAELYHPDSLSTRDDIIQEYRQKGIVKDTEVILKKKSGEKLYVSFNVTAVKDKEGNILYSRGIWRDITKLIAKRQKLSKLNETLREKNEQQATLFHILSHDIQSPIRTVEHLSKWIIEDKKNVLTAASLENLSTLRVVNKQAYRLTQDLVALFVNELTEIPSIFNLLRTVDAIKRRVFLPEGFKITVSSSISSFKTFNFLLTEVLYNLISNAVKHHHCSTAGEIKIEVEVQEKQILVKISDNGPGIIEDLREVIFEPLKKFHGDHNVEGYGMGLAIVKKIINQVGGKIDFTSIVGKGTTFYLLWPVFEELKEAC